MQRVLEPEVMDSWEEAVDYDSMDFLEVNTAFAERVLELGVPDVAKVLDVGTGTARIPVILGQLRSQWQIWGSDLAENMLRIGKKHIQQAGLQNQITLELVDAKQLPYEDESFDLMISNSLIHHIPEPLLCCRELQRVLKPNAAILLRDLIRPADAVTLNQLVVSVGNDYNNQQKKLFRDSLHAALTLDEVKQLISLSGLSNVTVYQSSALHWTAERAWG